MLTQIRNVFVDRYLTWAYREGVWTHGGTYAWTVIVKALVKRLVIKSDMFSLSVNN
jgi:hypothetical protein